MWFEIKLAAKTAKRLTRNLSVIIFYRIYQLFTYLIPTKRGMISGSQSSILEISEKQTRKKIEAI